MFEMSGTLSRFESLCTVDMLTILLSEDHHDRYTSTFPIPRSLGLVVGG